MICCVHVVHAVVDLGQRWVGTHLAGLWREHGAASWCSAFLDGRPVKMNLNLGWHAGELPVHGILEVSFRTNELIGDTAVHLSSAQANKVLLGFTSSVVSDLWRLSYLRILVACFYLPTVQAAQASSSRDLLYSRHHSAQSSQVCKPAGILVGEK
jgi:hypothetical protein